MNSRVAVRLIGKYLFWHGDNKTIRLSRRLTAGAIAAAVAAFIVALAISEGFEREMERVLTNFGPHIIVFDRGPVGRGPAPHGTKSDEVTPAEVFAARHVSEDQTKLWKQWRGLVDPLQACAGFYARIDDLIWNLEEKKSVWAGVLRAVHPFRVADWLEEKGLVPQKRLEDISGALQLAETGVVQHSRFIMTEGLALAGIGSEGEPQGVVIKGIEPDGLARMVAGRFDPSPKSWIHESDRGNHGQISVYAGKGLREKLKGDSIRFLSGAKLISLRVVGTFSTGLHEYDDRLIVGRFADVEKLQGVKEHGFDLWLDDPRKGRMVARSLADELGGQYQVLAWDDLYSSLFMAMATEKKVFGILMSVLLALCCFQVLGELLTFSWEKRSSWGLLRGLGLTERGLKWILYGRGFMLTVTSLSAGVGIGVVLVWFVNNILRLAIPADIYFVDHVPGKISGADLTMIVGLTLFFACVAMRMGARRVTGRPIAPLLHKGY